MFDTFCCHHECGFKHVRQLALLFVLVLAAQLIAWKAIRTYVEFQQANLPPVVENISMWIESPVIHRGGVLVTHKRFTRNEECKPVIWANIARPNEETAIWQQRYFANAIGVGTFNDVKREVRLPAFVEPGEYHYYTVVYLEHCVPSGRSVREDIIKLPITVID
jgi:hypothetical protein